MKRKPELYWWAGHDADLSQLIEHRRKVRRERIHLFIQDKIDPARLMLATVIVRVLKGCVPSLHDWATAHLDERDELQMQEAFEQEMMRRQLDVKAG